MSPRSLQTSAVGSPDWELFRQEVFRIARVLNASAPEADGLSRSITAEATAHWEKEGSLPRVSWIRTKVGEALASHTQELSDVLRRSRRYSEDALMLAIEELYKAAEARGQSRIDVRMVPRRTRWREIDMRRKRRNEHVTDTMATLAVDVDSALLQAESGMCAVDPPVDDEVRCPLHAAHGTPCPDQEALRTGARVWLSEVTSTSLSGRDGEARLRRVLVDRGLLDKAIGDSSTGEAKRFLRPSHERTGAVCYATAAWMAVDAFLRRTGAQWACDQEVVSDAAGGADEARSAQTAATLVVDAGKRARRATPHWSAAAEEAMTRWARAHGVDWPAIEGAGR